MPPLVSVVTPTWQRHDLMEQTILEVYAQDYPAIEHIIVSDGADHEFAASVQRGRRHLRFGEPTSAGRYRSIQTVELGRNTSGDWPESFGVAPLTVGFLLARGDYLATWCDDERALTRDHISRLADLLESRAVGFVYPRVHIWRNGAPDGPETAIIGTEPPRHGQITHYLFRRELLRVAMPRWGSHPCDWSLVSDWLDADVPYAMLPDVTFDHRLDR